MHTSIEQKTRGIKWYNSFTWGCTASTGSGRCRDKARVNAIGLGLLHIRLGQSWIERDQQGPPDVSGFEQRSPCLELPSNRSAKCTCGRSKIPITMESAGERSLARHIPIAPGNTGISSKRSALEHHSRGRSSSPGLVSKNAVTRDVGAGVRLKALRQMRGTSIERARCSLTAAATCAGSARPSLESGGDQSYAQWLRQHQ